MASAFYHAFVHAKLLQSSCPALCNPMDCSPPGSSGHGILQARILQGVAMPSSRASSLPRVKPRPLMSPVLASVFFTTSASWEAHIGSHICVKIELQRKMPLVRRKTSSTLIWKLQGHPTPVLLPGKSHGRRSLVGCSPWSR